MRLDRAELVDNTGAAPGARSATLGWASRSGVLLRIRTPDGLVGLGESSPLPGYSPDTLEQARSALERIAWARVPESEHGEPAAAYLARVAGETSELPPSARFALETALLDVLGQRAARPIWALFEGAPAEPAAAGTPVPLCSMIGGADDPGVVTRARDAAERGVHTVKLKIVGPSLEGQLETLSSVRAAIGDTPLRLDANQSLAAATASGELRRLVVLTPELVEEPVPLPALLVLEPPAVPLALDESLQDASAWSVLEPHLARLGCLALVLKPMALGGFSRCVALAAAARVHGLAVTVSHLFDGPVAHAASSHLALAFASRSRASGLDRHAGLGAWHDVSLPLLGTTTVVAGARPGLGLPCPWSAA